MAINIFDKDSISRELKTSVSGTEHIPHHNVDSIATPTTVYHDKVTVTTPGVQVVLGSTQVVKHLTVKALASNTKVIYVGGSSVSSSDGFELSAKEAHFFEIADVATIWIDVDTGGGGEGVTWTGVN